MEKVNNFQLGKVKPRIIGSFYLIFCQFQLGVAYERVAYKKSVWFIYNFTVYYRGVFLYLLLVLWNCEDNFFIEHYFFQEGAHIFYMFTDAG